jgi:outer membrane protein OmpA-like peptidoglycan-associated protein
MRMTIRGRVLLLSAFMMAGTMAWGQQTPSPAKEEPVSIDLAVTYSPERTQLVPGECCFWLQGAGADAAVTFWKGFGIAAAVNGEHTSNYEPGWDVNKISYLAGPRYTFNAWTGSSGTPDRPRLQIFLQGLAGGVHAFDGVFPSGSVLVPSANSYAIQAGGGLNLILTRHWGVRPFEADYVRTALPNGAGDAQNDLRLAAGVSYHIGTLPPPPVTIACSANPASVFPGDPVTVTAIAGSLEPKLNVIYSWSGTGVTGNGTTASVATASLAAGTYTVKCGVKEGKPGKEGLKPGQSAESSASFTVKAFEPPTIQCSANPTTIKPGEAATVTAIGVSPQNRPLTYSYSASAGTVSGTGTTATFSSTGAPTGTVGITCNVTDDKGQTAAANTSVTIVAPYVPPAPHTQALCSIAFEKDTKRPSRVDNEAKACLDDVALTLQKQADAKIVVVGESTSAEKAPPKKKSRKHVEVENLAAERAVNTKDYLVTEKGIDASRVNAQTGTADGQKVENYLVPAGASFTADVQGTTPVDETVVKPQVRKPLQERTHPAKKAQ